MTIAFACPACGKKYQVDDAMAGKKAKCQGCGKALQIPSPRKTSATPAPRTVPSEPDGSEFGLSGMAPSEDLFASAAPPPPGKDPLGGPVVEDYGFAPVEMPEEEPTRAVEVPQYAENQAISDYKKIQKETAKLSGNSGKGKKGKGGKDSGGGSILKSPAFWTAIPLGLLLLVGGILGIFAPGAGFVVAVITLILCGLAGAGAELWGIVRCYQHSEGDMTTFLLYFFLPPYRIYYWIVNFSAMKGVLALIGVCILINFLAVIELIVMMVLSGEFKAA